MNKLLQLKCCINIQQDHTYGILIISYLKVNDGNIMMLLLVASQTLPMCFARMKRTFLQHFSIIATLVCYFVGVANLLLTIMVYFLSHGLQQLNILKRSELKKINIGFNCEKVLYNLHIFGKLMNCIIQ